MPALPELYPFKSGPVEPIIMPGEIAGIWVNKVYHFYAIEYIEPIPYSDPIVIDLGAVVAGGAVAATQLTLLESELSELGQFRVFVLDDIRFRLWQARSDGRFRTKQRQAGLTRFTNLRDPCGHTTEFYVHEDDFAFLDCLNTTGYALTQSRVAFYGFRYVLEKLDQFSWTSKPQKLPDKWTRIPATAHL